MDMSKISENVKAYLGLYAAPANELTEILTTVVDKNPSDIYLQPDKLKNAMAQSGANLMQITKVMLMTQVSGFRELLDLDVRMQQTDLDRYVQNAVKETCFNRAQVLEITSAISMSLGIPFDIDADDLVQKQGYNEKAYVIPVSNYEKELNEICDGKYTSPQTSYTSDEMMKLEALALTGIPRAKYLLGYCLINNENFESSSPVGIQMLEEAAADGDSLAASALGDYYYSQASSDSWQKAYNYYTGYGRSALSKKRKDAITDIINHKTFNRKILMSSVFLVLCFLISLIIAPAASLFAAHKIFGFFCFAGSVAIIIVATLHHRTYLYDSLYYVPTGIFIFWFLYMAVRILF